MKKIIIYLATMLFAAATFTGCYDLETYPGDKVNEGTFYKTGDHAHQGLMGIYGMLRLNEAYGYQFCFDHLGDIAYGYNYYMMFLATYTDRDGTIQAHWQTFYDGIHRVNTFIRSVKGMHGIITDEQIDEYVAEAKFLRAMFYFSLTDLFGGVPYYDESTNVNEEFMNLKQPRNSLEEIRAHILEDLDEAIKFLPVEHAASEYGRATKGAAYALRGKVHLYDKEWQSAINDFEEIVYNKSNNYGYSLHPDYNELFRLYNGNHSPEMIFSIQSIDGNTAGYALDIVSYFGNKSTMRLIASNCIVPSTTLVDMYENLDGSPFDWDDLFPGFNNGDSQLRRKYMSVAIDLGSTVVTSTLDCDTTKVMDAYRRRDPRLSLNVITPYSHYLGTDAGSNPMDKQFVLADPTQGGAPMEAMAFIRNSEGWNSYFWRKWIPTGNLDGYWGEYNRTPYEFPLIRLGDVILMLAEAYNESGATDKAVTEVNKIRARVGMPGLNSGSSWLSVGGKEDMAIRIQRERAFELAGEGQRYWDLRRWGLLEKSVKNATDIFGDLMYTRSYQSRHELWPIPLVEMERNLNLTQNEGW